MPGKFSGLKDQLTHFSAEPEYQSRVNMKKQEIKTYLQSKDYPLSATSFGRILVSARLEKARLEDLVKEQNLIIEAMNQELVDQMESNEMINIKLADGVSLGIKDDVYCSVDDKEQFHAWIKANGLEDLFSVHYQTMSAMVKARLVEGEDIPPGIKPYFKQSIIVRGIKSLEQ